MAKKALDKMTKAELIAEAKELRKIVGEQKAALTQAVLDSEFTEGYTDDHRLNILAEIIKTGQRKASDLTQRYTILLETNNPNLLDLGKLPYDVILEVTFNLSEQKVKS